MRLGRRGILKDEPASESGPDEAALETGEGLRMVKETLEVIRKIWVVTAHSHSSTAILPNVTIR